MSTTYEEYESSTHDGNPIEAYRFFLPDDSYFYTNAESTQTVDGFPYSPTAISRSDIQSTLLGDDSSEVILTLPIKTDLAQLLISNVVPEYIELKIYRAHRDSNMASEFEVLWVGNITGVSVNGDNVQLRSPSIFETIMSTDIPTRYYQQLCNHVLFDTGCGLNPDDYDFNETVTDVDKQFIKVFGTHTSGVYSGGILELTDRGERRHIVYNSGDFFEVSYPFPEIEIGDAVKLTKGCNHTYAQCELRFNNTDNFLGFPYVPLRNPFKEGV